MATPFKDVAKANQVGLDVGMGVGERIAHTRLCGEVDDATRFFSAEKGFYRLAIGNIPLDELEVAVGLQLLQAGTLELGVVIVIEVVDADDVITTLK